MFHFNFHFFFSAQDPRVWYKNEDERKKKERKKERKKIKEKKMIDRAKMFDGCRTFKLSSHWCYIFEKVAGTWKRKLSEKFESHERLVDN